MLDLERKEQVGVRVFWDF